MVLQRLLALIVTVTRSDISLRLTLFLTMRITFLLVSLHLCFIFNQHIAVLHIYGLPHSILYNVPIEVSLLAQLYFLAMKIFQILPSSCFEMYSTFLSSVVSV